MTDIFVLTETGFDYNDEVHFVSEHGGGTPVAAFNTLEEANAEMKKATMEFLRGWGGDNLGAFGYGMDEIFSRKPAFFTMDEDEFMEMESYNLEEILVVSSLSDNDLDELADSINIEPYSVRKIPLG